MDQQEIIHKPAQNLRAYHRSACDTMEDMRNCVKTLNFAPIPGLIEEMQVYFNRMEAKLQDVKCYEDMKKQYKEMKYETSKND